jgi:hypothetical protein
MEWLKWEWSRFFMMIAGAGVGSAVVQVLMPIYRDRRMRRKHAAYMAMRLAVMMENFAWSCANFIQENHNAPTPADKKYPAWEITLPVLVDYPEDVDGWRALAPKMAARIFGMRNKLHESKSTIRNIIEFNKAELGWVLDEQAASRGLEAWRVAVDLRKTYWIEPVELEWNYPDYLRRALDKATKQRKEYQQRGGHMTAVSQDD